MNKILEARDNRVSLIESLLKKGIVISLRCNYPGKNKKNRYTDKVINYMNEVIKERFNVSESQYIDEGEGPVYLYVLTDTRSKGVKLSAIGIENQHLLGRLVDIDVYDKTIKSLSRHDFQVPSRKCYLCDEEAVNCIVHKRHSLETLIHFFHQTVDLYEKLPIDIIEYTNQAMLYELFTYPSFGLVSPYSSGAHQDMDYFTFIDSISVLNKYMLQFAYLAYQEKQIEKMLDEAINIGKVCEKEMFCKTKGVNTHKGLIFVLGTLVMSSIKMFYHNDSFDKIFENCRIITKNKLHELNQIDDNKLSNGEKVYLKYQKEGVRKEASLGFPIIQEALKYLDLENKDSLIKTLIYIMSLCEDTTIIHRKGLDGLEYVKKTMNHLMKEGFDNKLLLKINDQFIKEGISPGGSADLLCGTIFLSLIKNKMIKRREKWLIKKQ
ncbi:citrate lyase holo-[acyl-carrier protein] synthase [Mycoplasmatota bacterium]|nr:citrate lyase holo-[acyl-carrier protein] synthase [Mycoplasmatota bacterium]